MRAATVEKLIWIAIYGGIIVATLGLAVQRGDPLLGWVLVIAGALGTLAGAALVVVRSRMEPKENP